MIVFIEKSTKNEINPGEGVYSRVDGKTAVFYTDEGAIRERRIGRDKVLMTLQADRSWEHPWFTNVQFYTRTSGVLKNNRSEVLEGFGAVVRPGFVSGVDPVVPGAERVDILTSGQASSSLLTTPAPVSNKVSAGLMDGPIIPLYGFKKVEKIKKAPPIFAELGCRGTQDDFSVSGNASNLDSISVAANNVVGDRYLASTMIYLSCARPTTKMDVEMSSFNPVLGTGINYNVNFDMTSMALYGTRARLMVGSIPEKKGTTLQDRLAGVTGDEGLDYFPVATVYLVSPRDADASAGIDSSWIPFVKHHAFWNMEYRYKVVTPVTPPRSSNPYGGLGAITGRYTLAPMATLAAVNSEADRLLSALLNSTSTEGRFWTV